MIKLTKPTLFLGILHCVNKGISPCPNIANNLVQSRSFSVSSSCFSVWNSPKIDLCLYDESVYYKKRYCFR